MKVFKAKTTLITSISAIIVSFSILVGSTFAWFTDSASSGINKIQSGNLDVNLVYTNSYNGNSEEVGEDTKIFMDINGDPMLWEPGAWASGRFEVSNDGSLALKYQLSIVHANATKTPSGKTLADVLSVYALARNKVTGTDNVMGDSRLEALQIDSAVPGYDPQYMPIFKDGFEVEGYLLPQESITYEIGVCWEPTDNDNEFNVSGGLSLDFAVGLVATQVSYENDGDGHFYDGNASYPSLPEVPLNESVWDGTVDTSWYNETDTEFVIESASALVGLGELVDGGNNFAGKTIKLAADVDLGVFETDENGELKLDEDGNPIPISFNPIGDKSAFSGTFDGDGHVIENMYQSGWDFNYMWGQYGSIGLFGELENATIKNVTISGANAQVEGGDIGGICGSATGTCVFENITIADSDFGTYNNGIGGIIGWSGAGDYTFKNITIAEDVVLGGLWGSFDSSIGGVVGQAEPGATYNFENVNIACRLDAYNDVTASYQYYLYRMTGMIIGRCDQTTTIDGANYPDMSKYNITCKDVTVTYGDWMNYHYCLGFNGNRYTRVEAGYAYGGLDVTVEDHATTCTNHLLCLPFDGLFGGDQYGVRTIKEYQGVTVNYPASYNPEG